jgi:hypothetical protein
MINWLEKNAIVFMYFGPAKLERGRKRRLLAILRRDTP